MTNRLADIQIIDLFSYPSACPAESSSATTATIPAPNHALTLAPTPTPPLTPTLAATPTPDSAPISIPDSVRTPTDGIDFRKNSGKRGGAISCKLLSYQRYLHFQERLRRKRRELLLFCQHPPTLTAGVESRPDSLLVSPKQLKRDGVALFQVKRGGDYTAHEAGQCLIYPHIDLRRRKLAISPFFGFLLEITASTIQQVWKIPTRSDQQAPGLYHTTTGAKLLSIGLMFKAFFTSHGLALNICNNLKTFSYIHPCGYRNIPVASIEQYGGDPAASERFIQLWKEAFKKRVLL